MTEFDPAALLKQLRSKTPTRAPELPPRPIIEEPPPPKTPQIEERILALENQLKASLQNEQKYLKERDVALQQVKEMQSKYTESELRLNEKIKFLEAMLEREKQRTKEENLAKPKPPVKVDTKKPAFSPAVSSNSARYTPSKPKGILDLSPLVELYKIMPDFPRPVIKLDFSSIKLS